MLYPQIRQCCPGFYGRACLPCPSGFRSPCSGRGQVRTACDVGKGQNVHRYALKLLVTGRKSRTSIDPEVVGNRGSRTSLTGPEVVGNRGSITSLTGPEVVGNRESITSLIGPEVVGNKKEIPYIDRP